MANIALKTAGRVEVIESILQLTLIAAEVIVAGAPVRIDANSGKFTNANATTAGEAAVYGIAVQSVVAGQPLTALRIGKMDGFTFSQDYNDALFLSDTDGRIADAAGTVPVALGRIIAGNANLIGTSPDKILEVDVRSAVDTATTLVSVPATVFCLLNEDCVDQAFFIADRAYQVTAIREIHAVAGDDAGAVNIQVTKDTGTDAPGAGANLLTNNANAGFNAKGTANTVQAGTLTATGADLLLAAGNRLSLDFAGTVATLAGVVVVVTLAPV